jgi:hypothetical protein
MVMARARHPDPTGGTVLGVLGASGGIGGSTLAVALGLTAARTERAAGSVAAVCCVDGHLSRGGLDVTACVEHRPGLRWGDLSGVRGEVPGEDLLAELPEVAGVRLLSASPGAGPVPPAPGPAVPRLPGTVAVEAVLRALRRSTRLVVVDVPPGAAAEPFLVACDAVVLLSGATARHLADAAAASALAAVHCPRRWLIVRGSPRGSDLPEAMAAHLGLPLVGRWRDEPRLAVDAERGRAPGSARRSRLAALCERVLEQAAGLPSAGPPPAGVPATGLPATGLPATDLGAAS